MKETLAPNFEQDAELLGKILQTSVSAITVLDTEGSIVFANEAAKEILGLVPSEITGKTFNDPRWEITTFDGEPFPEEELPFKRVYRTKKPVYDVQHAIQWPDGTRRFLSINGAPILDKKGALKQVVFSVSDITEEKKMAEELRLSEKRFRDVAEASGEYIWELDTEGKYIYASNRLGEMLDRPVEEMMGRTPFDFMPKEEAERVGKWFGDVVRNREAFKDFEHASLRKDGRMIWQRVSGLPIFDGKGNFNGYRGTAADITEHKESEVALKESSERLEMAVAASGLGIWDLDIASGSLTWDDSMLDMYGIAKEDFTSAYDAWEEALHPDDRYEAETALQDTMQELKPFDVQFRIVRPDGENRIIHAIARAYFDDHGTPERIVGINMDITERLESENALRENEAKLSSLYDIAPVAIILNRKSDGTFLEANPELFRLTGYTEEEYKDLSYWDITPEKYAEAEKRQLEELDRRGGYGPFEKEYIRKNGSLVPVLLRGVGIKAADGEEVIWSIVQDISEQKMHERELREAKEEAESANLAKSEFLANMSHEIRTPMNAVIGLSQLLLNTEMRPDQEDKLHKIHQSSKMLLGIINDILDFSKIESGKLELEYTDFRMREVVDQLSTLFYQAMNEKDIELFFHVALDVPYVLLGDSLRIGQVLTNLLSNAVKFTHEGSIKLFVRMLEQDDKKVKLQFEVKDTGIGMSREQMDRLFTPFTQADSSTTRKYGGTGLGLVISSRIVEAMGGNLEVESEPNVGTVFRFQLELAFSDKETAPPFCEILASRKILVVDDNEEARSILSEMLESCNMRVELAAGGEEGIEKIMAEDRAGKPFDLILMDWKMPGLNGLEASRKLRKLAGKGELLQKSPSILMVSAYNFEETGIEEDEEIDYIPKPVTASSLFDALMRAANGESGKRKRAADRSTRIEAPVFTGLRVLLVEDNELNQEVAYNLLIRTEAEVDIAQNGREAVSMAKEHLYDIIFMDLQMPDMDGFEATRIIREKHAHIPIIALTAAALQEDRKKVEQTGFNDHLTKPIDTEELYRAMEKYAQPRSTGAGTAVADPADNQQPGESSPLPENLPGFDISAGIDINGGDAGFYQKMLLKYRGQLEELFSTLLEQIDALQSVEEKNRDSAFKNVELTAHSLKGVSGNMAAVTLQNFSAQIESRLKKGHLPAKNDIESLESAFNEVSRGFDILEKEGPKRERRYTPQDSKEPDLGYVREIYTRLRDGEILEDHEVERLLDAVRGAADEEEVKRLFEYIDDLRYEEAADLLGRFT